MPTRSKNRVIVEIALRAGKYIAGLGKAGKSTKKFSRESKKNLAAIKKRFIGITAAVAGLGYTLSMLLKRTDTQIKSEKRLATVLRATGHAAGLTLNDLTELSSSLQRVTTYGDEVINTASSLMLTFTQISGTVFPDAIEAAMDMSQTFGQDLQQSVVQLGTALNDPIAGVGRLRDIGVSFSAAQKQQIEQFMAQNDIMSAQRVILDELQREFGGMARAMAQTPWGRWEQFTNELGDSAEVLGRELLPGFQSLFTVINQPMKEGSFLKKIGKFFSNALVHVSRFLVSVRAIPLEIENAFSGMKMQYLNPRAAGRWNNTRNQLEQLADNEHDISAAISFIQSILEANREVQEEAYGIIEDVQRRYLSGSLTALRALQGHSRYLKRTPPPPPGNNGLRNTGNTGNQGNGSSGNESESVSDVPGFWHFTEEQLREFTISQEEQLNNALTNHKEYMANLKTSFTDGFFSILGQAQSFFSQMSELEDMALQNKLANLDIEYNQRKAYIEANISDENKREKALAALDKEIEQKQKKLERDAAKKKKEIAEKEALLNIPLMASSAYKATVGIPYVGPYVAPVFAATAAKFGLEKYNMVKEQPLPALYNEGIVPGSKYGTPVIAGDKGKPEAIMNIDRLGELLGMNNNSRTIQIMLDKRVLVEAVEDDRYKKASMMGASNYSFSDVYK